MATAFAAPGNNVSTTVGGSGYTAGAGSLVMATGAHTLFPTLTGSQFYRVTVSYVAFAYSPTATSATYTIFKATGLNTSTDTLTGLTAIEGTVDNKNFSLGDVVEVRVTAGTLSDIQNAVNTLENAPDMTIGHVISGATNNAVLYVNGSGNLADSANLTYDGTNVQTSGGISLSQLSGVVTISGASGASNFASAKFLFPQGGIFYAIETPVVGSAYDVFFQALPANSSGYGYLESWNAAGMILGTGNQTSTAGPVLIKPNRSTTGTFATDGSLTMTGAIKSSGGYLQATTGSGAPATTPANGSMYYDTTGNFLYIYNGGWKKSTVYA